MIDQEIAKIANNRIRIEIEEQNSRLRSEIGRFMIKMRDSNAVQSSSSIRGIADLCIDTIKNRAQLVWQTLFRFITTAGISYSPELSDELKGLVACHLPEELGDLRDYIKQKTELIIGSPSLYERIWQDLDSARDQALSKVGTEIDLFVHSLKKKADIVKDGMSSTVFNIYSPVGSIQTGDNSIANVTQNIDTEVKEQIRKALEEINSTLTRSEVETPTPKGELIEVVQESQVELQKEKPNVTRLRSLLTTVGTSIQVVSSLKPAYETLKQALTFIGISLP
jgi:hypothetical protein